MLAERKKRERKGPLLVYLGLVWPCFSMGALLLRQKSTSTQSMVVFGFKPLDAFSPNKMKFY